MALAESVDAMLAPLVAAVNAVATSPEAFRLRRALALASLLVADEKSDDHAQTEERVSR